MPEMPCKLDNINFNVEHTCTCTQLVSSMEIVNVISMLRHSDVMEGGRGEG